MSVERELTGTTEELSALGILLKALDRTDASPSLSKLSEELFDKLTAIG